MYIKVVDAAKNLGTVIEIHHDLRILNVCLFSFSGWFLWCVCVSSCVVCMRTCMLVHVQGHERG